MTCHPVYAILTEIPVVFFFYDSSLCSGIFLIFIFAVSVWNGGGFYIEVFGRKYVICVNEYRRFLTLIADLSAN